jgi:hypothetical protein
VAELGLQGRRKIANSEFLQGEWSNDGNGDSDGDGDDEGW